MIEPRLTIKTEDTHAIIELRCVNGHSFDLSLEPIDMIEINKPDEETRYYMCSSIECPECGESKIDIIDLGKL